MAELRGLFEALGFKSVETFIASGNVIFESRSTDISAMQRRIEERLLKALGYEVKTFIRTDADVAAIAQYKPFKASRVRGPRVFRGPPRAAGGGGREGSP